MLKPQDILVALKFLSSARTDRKSYAVLSESVGLSASETHSAVQRASKSGLLLPSPEHPENLSEMRASAPAMAEVLCYGVSYFLPAEAGRISLGFPTADSAPPLANRLVSANTQIHVWAHPRGSVRGAAIEPLYPSAPEAALRDPALAEWLALTDALRLFTGRVAELARNEVLRRLGKRS